MLNNLSVILSIIIPAYDEENRIIETLRQTLEYLQNKNFGYEIIIVNDGSKDNTEKVVKEFIQKQDKKTQKKIKLISYKKNQGKGYAVKTGMLNAKGDLILFMDADLATPIEELDKLMKYIDKYDIVIGSRVTKKAKRILIRKVLGKIAYFITNLVLGLGIKDTQCGFKLFKKHTLDIFKEQKIFRWGFDFEILYIAKKKGYKIKEVPVSWQEMPGSKVKLIDYIKTLRELVLVKRIHKQIK